ncbi:hypothetical protein [Haladaptatus sp. R4]|uniref:hypothetical protein n=1 Tax=Haladaptatus sp. R4 TaxID=1679489 RepID=UPI0012371995|nr:hypothetical protein [Haladaptatus sp. R4]
MARADETGRPNHWPTRLGKIVRGMTEGAKRPEESVGEACGRRGSSGTSQASGHGPRASGAVAVSGWDF